MSYEIKKFLTQYSGSVPNRQSDSPIIFAQNVYDYQLWMNDYFSIEVNPIIIEMNTLSQVVSQDALQVSIDKSTTNFAKDETLSARDEAVLAKNEIKGYVIPTEATYSPITIEAKLDMAETLNLVGA